MTEVEEVRDAVALAGVYDTILRPSFPAAELVPLDWLVRGVRDGRVRVLASTGPDGVDAVAVTERLRETSAVLLSYVAARADRRGRGVGSSLYSRVLDDVTTLDRPSLVLAEVERPDAHPGDDAHGDPAARLRFYGRHGARVLDLPYFQPAIEDTGARVHGMLLLALQVDPGLLVEDGTRLAEDSGIDAAVDALLAGEPTDGSDAAAESLRAAARVAGGVRLRAVDDYARVARSRG